MKNMIKFTDAITGYASIKKGLNTRDLRLVNDSTSGAGKGLVAQIEMTHSGVVTRNMGFYMPDNMKKGAHTFTKHYKKPVLIGHDSDTDPVGRVIKADYVDTSAPIIMNDKYLKSLMNFDDKKQSANKETMVEFAQHVIGEYSHKDSYRGLGHILGTLQITDEETIQKILDERYLTVSISMSSDAAYCSECGQDWVSEGRCDHERGQIYDSGIPVVLIPGKQSYNHVGIVSEPADVHAAGFKAIELTQDNVTKKLDSVIQVQSEKINDGFSIAANLFSYQDSKLISLSDESQTDLFVVKDNIQKLEDSLKTMENDKMAKKFTDDVSACISLYAYGENGESTSVELRKYLKSLTAEQIAEMGKQAVAALGSQEIETDDALKKAVHDFLLTQVPTVTDSVTTEGETTVEPKVEDGKTEPVKMKKVKTLNDRFKLVDSAEYPASTEDSILEEIQKIEGVNLTAKDAAELASLIARSQNGDVLASLTIETKDKTIEECVKSFLETKDSRFKIASASEVEVAEKMNTYLADDSKIDVASFDSILAKECAGSGRYFPILNKACVEAAQKVLGLAIATDSMKGRILENIAKLSSKFVEDSVTVEATEVENSTESTENFDSQNTECNNQLELTDEALITELTKLVQIATERSLIDSIIAPFLVEKEQEIGVLEQQLTLANDEIEELLTRLTEVKDNNKKELAEKVVDAKIKSGLFGVSDRESEIEKHLERSEDSLKDMFEDFAKAKTNNIADSEKVESPVAGSTIEDLNTQIIQDTEVKKTASDDLKKKEIKRTYNLLKITKGIATADAWLNKQEYQV